MRLNQYLTERICAVLSESEPQLRMTVLYKISERIVCRAGVNLSEYQHILDEIERLKTKFYTVLPTSKSAQCHLSVIVLRQTAEEEKRGGQTEVEKAIK